MKLHASSPNLGPVWRYWVPRPPRLALDLGQICPDFAHWDVTHQRTVRLANWRGRQPVVLVFCRIFADLVYSPQRYAYLVAINQAYPQFRNAGAEVLLITNTIQRQGQALVHDLGLTLPLLCDVAGSSFRAYFTGQAWGAPLPAQFVLDAQGCLRYSHLYSILHAQAAPEILLERVEAL
ncbi:redoxin domain-containing protein [Nodosilinea sp. LEGE 07088]|uniref:redoxin domain-containing protein n=1 Tax=Nodosilinea sp. LEGE 07088 TaxID=2777968 RepID=UPI001881E194|nr:redoxin domain-containing protein [Nodosilinea sp. LEGE 07088]MBE9136345.1 redoxin domain-containing protein [Nodosilinea sp. LEGE 07088]